MPFLAEARVRPRGYSGGVPRESPDNRNRALGPLEPGGQNHPHMLEHAADQPEPVHAVGLYDIC